MSAHGKRSGKQRGQAIVMMTLALIAMCGLLGLAVDLGWAYYVKKGAQSAADSAALAAVLKGQSNSPGTPPFTSCPSGLTCTASPQACSGISRSSNLWSACQYANQNGFTDMSAVLVDASVPAVRAFTPLNAGAGTVSVFYWVTVRVNSQIPQLFSAVMGNANALVSARATAALTNIVTQGSLVLLNRQNDPAPFMTGTHSGVDLVVGGNAGVTAPSGIIISSTNCGQNLSASCQNTSNAAAQLQGTQSSVTNTAFSYFRGNAGWDQTGNPTWTNAPVNGKSDGPAFYDPMAGKTQPSLQSNITTNPIPVLVDGKGNANLPAGTYGSGAYFAASGTGCSAAALSKCTATGGSINITGDVTFTGGNFGQFVFFGGLHDQGNKMTLGPGMYVMAGSADPSTPILSLDNKSNITDGGPAGAEGSTAGEIFVFTKPAPAGATTGLYPGLASVTPAPVAAIASSLDFGSVGFKAGNSTSINLHGLDATNTNLPTNLQTYAPVVFWQDRANSSVLYNSTGQVLFQNAASPVQGCPANDNSLDLPCPGLEGTSSTTPGMTLDAHASLNLFGAIYQPRGAYITMQGGGGISGPLQLITGAINDQGGTALTLMGLSNPITTLATALVE